MHHVIAATLLTFDCDSAVTDKNNKYQQQKKKGYFVRRQFQGR
jgi:hypothetical protein